MTKIKVLHTADIHIGIENYGYINPETGLNLRLEDFLRAFDTIVDHAINNDFDLVIFAGDAFKSQSPTATQQREFAKRVFRLAKNNIPTILLAGNHDLSNRYGEATSMDVYSALEIDNVHVIRNPWFNTIKTKNGEIQVLGIPYVSKSAFLTNEELSGKKSEEIETTLIKRIEQLIDSFIIKADPNKPLLFTFHTGVDQAQIGAEKDLMVGKCFSLPLGIIAKKQFDYVALGHIHKHQVLCKEPLVIFPGSIERVDFGEEKEEKGFIEAFISKGETEYNFVELPARKFITIKVDVTESEDPNQEILDSIAKYEEKLPGSIIRLRYTAFINQNHLIDDKKIRSALEKAFFYLIRPNIHDNEPRVRQPELNESISHEPILALEKYLEIHPHLEEIKDDLLKRAKYLVNHSGE